MKSNKVFLIFVMLMIMIQIIATILMIKISNQQPIVLPTNTPTPTSTPTPTPVPIVVEIMKPYVVSRGGEEHPIETFIGKITMYTAGYESTGKRPNNPLYGITASGRYVKANHTIAMDKRYPFGTLVVIEGFEDIIFEVEDRGGAITDNDIDVYISNKDEAMEWGVQHKEVKILRLGEK